MSSGTILLKFINFILGLLPDFDLSSIPAVENVADFLNIFAWVNVFVPTDVIMILLSLTASYYVFRGIYVVLKDFFF